MLRSFAGGPRLGPEKPDFREATPAQQADTASLVKRLI
jgi:hypothetical protein